MTYVVDPAVFAVADGYVQVPKGPGLGVQINEELVRSSAVNTVAWRNPVWRGEDGSVREW